jgi:hypothetical protein
MGNGVSVIELGQGKIENNSEQDFTGKNLEENYMMGVYEKDPEIPELVNNNVCYDYFGVNTAIEKNVQTCTDTKPIENIPVDHDKIESGEESIMTIDETKEIILKMPTLSRMKEMELQILEKILYPVPITFTKGMFGKTATETFTSLPILEIENRQFGTKAIKYPLILQTHDSFFKGETISSKRGFYHIGKTIDMFHEFKVETFPTDTLISAELYIGLTEPIFLLKKINLYMTNNKCEKAKFFSKAISNIFSIPGPQFWIKINVENANDKIFDYFTVRRLKVYSYIFIEEFRREICNNTDIPNDVIDTLQEMESFCTEKNIISVEKM